MRWGLHARLPIASGLWTRGRFSKRRSRRNSFCARNTSGRSDSCPIFARIEASKAVLLSRYRFRFGLTTVDQQSIALHINFRSITMQVKKIFAGMLVVGGAVASIAPAHADQLADIKGRGELSCGVYSNVEPFSYPNAQTRQLEGMDVDLCNAVAKQLGVKAKLEPLAVEARIPQLKLGRVDIVVANLAYTKTRATQISFSDSD